MYHCYLQLYLVGPRSGILEAVKELPPLERFTHTFLESETPEPALVKRADVILADLRGTDARQALEVLRPREGAELLILVEKEQIPLLPLAEVKDVWTAPLSEEELRFRFLRWQEGYRQSRDAWESSQFLEAAINSVPDLI